MTYEISEVKDFNSENICSFNHIVRLNKADYKIIDKISEDTINFSVYSYSIDEERRYKLKIKDVVKKQEITVANITEFPDNCGIAILSNVALACYYAKGKKYITRTKYDLIFNAAFYFIANKLRRRFVFYTAAEYQKDLIKYLNKNWENPIKLGRNPSTSSILYTWTKDLRNCIFCPEDMYLFGYDYQENI
jgi:hypothetical protein